MAPMSPRIPVVFLLGPSGAGKTTLGQALEDQANFLHLQIDRFPEGDGIDLEGLRDEWTRFCAGDATMLLATLQARVSMPGEAA